MPSERRREKLCSRFSSEIMQTYECGSYFLINRYRIIKIKIRGNRQKISTVI